MVESWRSIPGYDGYEVSDLGRVRSLDRRLQRKNGVAYFARGKMLKASPDDNGYPQVRKGLNMRVHQAVMLAFVGPAPVGHEVAHNDGKEENCRLDNLRYATSQSNNMDKLVHGTMLRGAKHPQCTLTEADILTIRMVADETQRALAERFGVSQATISNIVNRKTWGWL